MTTRPDQWWNETWNPNVMQCTRVWPGCDNCWHLRFADRHACNPAFPMEIQAAYRGTGKPILREDVLEKPLHWKRPRRIAVQMMGDLGHSSLDMHHLHAIFDVMRECRRHEFIIPTKRPSTLERFLHGVDGWPFPNVTILVSAWDQESADRMIPQLLQVQAARRGVSLEPLLGPVYLMELQRPWEFHESPYGWNEWLRRHLHVCICGAETGPHARPMKLEWAMDLRDQCKAAGIPFWFKTAGPGVEIPQGLLVREWPK